MLIKVHNHVIYVESLENILSSDAPRSIIPCSSGAKRVILPAELEPEDEIDRKAEANHDFILL
jgi:hypothetical protein